MIDDAQAPDARHVHEANGDEDRARRDASSERTARSGGERTAPGTRTRRLLWFGGLWLVGVLAVSVVAGLIRMMIAP